jgi:hypothetical protein
MNTLWTQNESEEPGPCPRSDGSGRSHCLLAVRKAGASFSSPHNVRSGMFEAIADNYLHLTRQIDDARDTLVRALHQAVPQAKTPAERHELLKIKRRVLNGSVLATATFDVLDDAQRLEVTQYGNMLRARDALLSGNRAHIFQDFRNQLNALLLADDFCCALNDSCPWLIAAYLRHGPGDNTDFSNEERGIYSYATRFFSKANPFHVFAGLAFPAHTGLNVTSDYEIVLNTKLISALERLILKKSTSPLERFVYLRSFRSGNTGYEFFVRDKSALMRIPVKNSLALQTVVAYFSELRSRYTFGDCVEYLAGELTGAERPDLEQYLLQLVDRGIVVEYLVADFDHFADHLLGVVPEYDSAITSLQRHHLARIGKADLQRVDREVKDSVIAELRFEDSTYYLNSYSRDDTAEYEAAADRLYPALRAISPLFLPCNNFADFAYVSSGFIYDQCATRQNGVSYLELLSDFLHDPASIVSRYHPSAHRAPETERARQAWLRRLTECQGILSDEELAWIVSERPRDKDLYSGEICFNGAVDPITGMFYPHNFFSGNGRYASRYLLGEAAQRRSRVIQEECLLDVQIAPAYDNSRFYVARMLPTGCGFDARCRHQFRHWIDPADITVTVQDGHIIYREAPSGRALRFHFFGFLLGELLNPEYQLLLTGHADFFNNPFEREPSVRHAMEHIPPLYYRTVCLRREQWRFPRAFFDAVWKQEDILSCTISLLSILRDAGLGFTKSYFELFDPATRQRKPRYFEICNPLGVHVFRRAVRSSSSTTIVSIARMEPPAEHFVREGQCFPMMELMIEA